MRRPIVRACHNQRLQQTIPSANKFASGLAPDPRRLYSRQYGQVMPSGFIKIEMAPSKLPDGVKTFQTDEFDPGKLDDQKIKQIYAAIDCFKIIHSCLKSYFGGQIHMYKPISVQLRILFCDFRRRKDHSLIFRIHPDIKMMALKKLRPKQIFAHPLSVASCPYVIESYPDGVVNALFDFEPPYKLLPLEEWRNQIVDLRPTLKLIDIIRSVADKEGAHIDDKDSSILKIMRKGNPTKIGSNILFIIALAHFSLDFANQIVPVWMQNGKIKI